MQIQLIQSIVRNLHLTQVETPNDGISEFEFEYNVSFVKSNPKTFLLCFHIKIYNPKEFTLALDYNFIFSTTDDITDSFISSHFPIINAPAIAFPFIRVFISNITLNSGFQPTILPSINFTQINKYSIFVDGIKIV